MKYIELYEKIMSELDKMENNEERFNTIFLLTTTLIYNMSNCGDKKRLKTILEMLQEFDYKKNFK